VKTLILLTQVTIPDHFSLREVLDSFDTATDPKNGFSIQREPFKAFENKPDYGAMSRSDLEAHLRLQQETLMELRFPDGGHPCDLQRIKELEAECREINTVLRNFGWQDTKTGRRGTIELPPGVYSQAWNRVP
jgi:hypothetical protein